jgi:hypothetical protein
MIIERQNTGDGLSALQLLGEIEEMGRRFKDIFRRLFLPGTPAVIIAEEEQTIGKK